MKKLFILLCITVIVFASCKQSSQDSLIELPLTFEKGCGPFYPSMGTLHFPPHEQNNPWSKLNTEYVGIPADWIEISVALFQFDSVQFAYQDYKAGNITEEVYNLLRNSSDGSPDESELSDTPIKCYVGILRGKNAQGDIQYIVDNDNNLDFSDNEAFGLTPQSSDTKISDSETEHVIPVKYERIYQNKIREEETYLMMQTMEKYPNAVFANNAQYATANLDGHKLGILSAHFRDMTFKHPSVAIIPPDLPKGEKINMAAILKKNEYIELDNNIYKILKVDRNRDVLCLEKTTRPRHELESTQLGFKTFPIAGEEFSTKDSISLSDYKGKYLFLDFWSTWCGSCIAEFPNLKVIYTDTDRSKFDILGIVGDSRASAVSKIIEDKQVPWKQLLSTEDNPITKTYNVYSYPTTFLIDPDGIIIARNLWGKQLKEKLKELNIYRAINLPGN